MYTLTILPDARTVRERFASVCPCIHCAHCVGFVRYTQTTSGCVRSGRERYASAWLCSVNARGDASGASGASGRERRTVCACLQTDLFIFTDTIHMIRKGDICHALSTYLFRGACAVKGNVQVAGHVKRIDNGAAFNALRYVRRRCRVIISYSHKF